MSCSAPPGWYCPPLSSSAIVCPENWYCPGGAVMARRCPDGRWSAIKSVYPEDCHEHMTVNMAVIVMLFAMLVVLSICAWAMSWEWENRERRARPEIRPCHACEYGTATLHGRQFTVYRVPGQP